MRRTTTTVDDDDGHGQKGSRVTGVACLTPTVTVLTPASPLDWWTWRDAVNLGCDLGCEVRLVEEDGATALVLPGRWTSEELSEVMDMDRVELAVEKVGL
jgi:hypothetical protein